MIAIAVWYDPDCDEIWITGEDRSYARRSLVASIDPDTGRVVINPKGWTGPAIIKTPYTNLTDKAGLGFLSAIEAKAYLDGEFAKAMPLSFTYAQIQPSVQWIIPHPLGYQPGVSLTDTAGDPMTADPRYPDANTVVITFSAPTAGIAYLS